MRILISLLMLLVAMPNWAAEERLFDVEVIIFKRSVNAENMNESWPDYLSPVSYQNSASLNSAGYLSEKGVTLLPRSMYQLNDQAYRLRNHAGFQVLMHTAWRQGGNGQSTAPTFHLFAGKDFSTQFTPNGKEVSPANLPGSEPLMEFEGKLQIYVQHYLFANAEFDLREPVTRKVSAQETLSTENPLGISDLADTPDAMNTTEIAAEQPTTQLGNLQAIETVPETENVLKTYRFDQKRKMKSDEIHYFDHPLLGMIIQVRKADSEATAAN